MSEELKRTIDPSEAQLNSLFKELLDGLRDDINEAQSNVDMYYEEVIKNDTGREAFGTLYNDALRIKGSARDRQLKFINTFKDRVTKKEDIKIQQEIRAGKTNEANDLNYHTEMNKMLESMKDNGKLEEIDLNTDWDDDE